MITAATGLSDWEWQVTLFADDPKAIRGVVDGLLRQRVDAIVLVVVVAIVTRLACACLLTLVSASCAVR